MLWLLGIDASDNRQEQINAFLVMLSKHEDNAMRSFPRARQEYLVHAIGIRCPAAARGFEDMGPTHLSYAALLIGWLLNGTANGDLEECDIAVYENIENVLRNLAWVVEFSSRAPKSGVATPCHIGGKAMVSNAQQRRGMSRITKSGRQSRRLSTSLTLSFVKEETQ